MRRRTQARELALMMLAQAESRGDEALREFEFLLGTVAALDAADEDEQELNRLRHAFALEEVREFARRLTRGCLEHRSEIDVAIGAAAQNWHLTRMALVDRNILRLAVYEMMFMQTIPAKVSINEAIELGKRFSTQQSGSFINGILDRIRRERQL